MAAISNAQTGAKTVNFIDFHEKVQHLFKQDKVNPNDLDGLTEQQYDYLSELCAFELIDLQGKELADLVERISPLLLRDMNESIWAFNHNAITKAISKLMLDEGCMPSRNKIARATGLSRITVARHLESYDKDPAYIGQQRQFKFLANNVLTTVYKSAQNGDVRAARLYLESTGAITKQRPGSADQSNYIQVNKTILSQENVQHLSAGELSQIESIVDGARQRVLGLTCEKLERVTVTMVEAEPSDIPLPARV